MSQLKILLASKSKLKTDALTQALTDLGITDYILEKCSVNDDPDQIQQPLFEGGIQMAMKRLKVAQEHKKGHDLIIVIENYMDKNEDDHWIDIGFITVESECQRGLKYTTRKALCGTVPKDEIYLMDEVTREDNVVKDNNDNIIGSHITFGHLYHDKYPNVPKDDWTGSVEKLSRQQVLMLSLKDILTEILMKE